MRRHSIRIKFFLAISAVALVFIGVLFLLNLFFYDGYYLFTRKTDLLRTYESISREYTGDIAAIASALDAYESRSAIRLAIVDGNGNLKYSSSVSRESNAAPSDVPFMHDGSSFYPSWDAPPTMPSYADQQFRSIAVLFAVMDSINLPGLSPGKYDFLTVTLRGDERFLCLAGGLQPESEGLIAYMPYAFIQQNSSFNLVFLLIAGGCALLLCLPCGYAISRQFTRRLIEMDDVANCMAMLDFSRKCENRGADEIGRLGQSLNRLSAYLEQSIGELREKNTQLAQEISEKERVDNMRREFIVNVSHELKTPIALIQGYAEGLQCGIADDPEDQKYYCDTISEEADHMNKLVMQLLSLSKLELGAEEPNMEEVDLGELCEQAVHKTAVLCEGRGLTLSYGGTNATVRTDGDLLEQVLMNYLSNAIRYTPDGGHIALSVESNASGTRIAVFNEGEGLPEEELSMVWEKFYRTDRARTREAGGTGIGLSLVRAIADTLHAAYGAENAPDGIVFWFELPKQDA